VSVRSKARNVLRAQTLGSNPIRGMDISAFDSVCIVLCR
jgi:hypothetical protein